MKTSPQVVCFIQVESASGYPRIRNAVSNVKNGNSVYEVIGGGAQDGASMKARPTASNHLVPKSVELSSDRIQFRMRGEGCL